MTLGHVDYNAESNTVKLTIREGAEGSGGASGAKISQFQKYVPVFDEEAVNRDLLA